MRADEYERILNADPEFQRRRWEREALRQRKIELYARAEAPLVAALRDAGVTVASVWDLVNTAEPYTHVLPILLEHLQRPYPDRIKEGIGRAMAVRESKFAWSTLLKLFRQSFEQEPNGVKWAIGCALAAAADDEVMSDVIALFCDPRHGENRLAFVDALRRSRNAAARAAMEEAREDPQLAREMRRVLGRPRKPQPYIPPSSADGP